MTRKTKIDENGIKRGSWSQEEDDKLKAYVLRYGHWNWRQLPKFAGLNRCGKSCRLRWLNYLKKDVKRGNYTKEEEDLILYLRQELGNKWSIIATKLPGRTDNEIKNYWHSRLKKRNAQIPAPSNSESTNHSVVSNNYSSIENSRGKMNVDENNIVDVSSQQTSQSSSPSTESSLSELSSDLDYMLSNDIMFMEDRVDSFESFDDFFTEPVLMDGLCNKKNSFEEERNVVDVSYQETSQSSSPSTESSSSELSSDNVFIEIEDHVNSFESIDNFWTEPFLIDGLYNQPISFSTSVDYGTVPAYDSYYNDNIKFFDQEFLDY